MSFVEQARKRIEELREKIKARKPLLGESMLRGEREKLLGGGRLVQQVGQNIDRLVARAKERRPNIIPTVMERIKTYEPGKRLKELVPVPTSEIPAQQSAPTETYRKILRE
jgi:hypothetical protein